MIMFVTTYSYQDVHHREFTCHECFYPMISVSEVQADEHQVELEIRKLKFILRLRGER